MKWLAVTSGQVMRNVPTGCSFRLPIAMVAAMASVRTPAVVQIDLAGTGEADMAGGAVQKPQPQPPPRCAV